jgi:hypothetical protein
MTDEGFDVNLYLVEMMKSVDSLSLGLLVVLACNGLAGVVWRKGVPA